MKLRNKEALRKQLIAKRQATSPEERQKAALSAALLLQASSVFSASNRIACYFAQNSEFDCMPIIELIWQQQKECYLPVLSANQALTFKLYYREGPLRGNRYNILEPEGGNACSPDSLDLIIVPLVGFSLKGDRLGMGGGYYDRTFAFLKNSTSFRPYLLGLAYEFQKLLELPCGPWDVPLHGALTEKEIYRFI